MRYEWPQFAKRGWVGARILAAAAAFALLALGHHTQASATTVAEGCTTQPYVGCSFYVGSYTYTGDCSTTRACWCYGYCPVNRASSSARDSFDCSYQG